MATYEVLRKPGDRPDGECAICMENLKKLKRLVIRLPCGHVYCRKCIVSHARVRLADDGHVTCPDPVCRDEFNMTGLIGRKWLAKSEVVPVENCPSVQCRGVFKDGRCLRCHKTKCGECGELEHPDRNCDPLIKANYVSVMTESRPCPNCKAPIHKYVGCNHVKCSRCKVHFNYETLQPYTASQVTETNLFNRGELERLINVLLSGDSQASRHAIMAFPLVRDGHIDASELIAVLVEEWSE